MPVFRGETLRQIRMLKGIKQSFIAKKIGVSQQAYSKIEQAKHIDEKKMAELLMMMDSSIEQAKYLQEFSLPASKSQMS